MLFHVKCGNQIGTRGGIEVVALVGVDSSKKVLTTTSYVAYQSKKKVEKELFCPECLTKVEINDIYTTCGACGDSITPDHAYVVKDAGAILCPTHVKRYSKVETSFLLIEILEAFEKGK